VLIEKDIIFTIFSSFPYPHFLEFSMKINDAITNLIMPRSVGGRDAHSPASNGWSSGLNRDATDINKTDASVRSVDPSGKTSESITDNNKAIDKQLDEAIKQANQFFQDDNRSLQFIRDEETDKMVVIIKDTKTDKVIRQIPSELMLKLSEQLERSEGMLFEYKA
jgi:flagellar protein FlaG